MASRTIRILLVLVANILVIYFIFQESSGLVNLPTQTMKSSYKRLDFTLHEHPKENPGDPTHPKNDKDPKKDDKPKTDDPKTTDPKKEDPKKDDPKKDDPKTDHHGKYIPQEIYEIRAQKGSNVNAIDFFSLPFKQDLNVIFGSSGTFERGGVVGPTKKSYQEILCRLKNNKNCFSHYIADVIDTAWAFCPLYTYTQGLHNMYQLHDNFVGYMKTIGLSVAVLEAIYPGQQFIHTSPNKEPVEMQIHIEHVFYRRENLLNVQAKKHKTWEYLLWIDAHQFFDYPYWWEDTIWKLEHHATSQMFYEVNHRDGMNKTKYWLTLEGIQYAGFHTTPFYKYPGVAKGLFGGNAFGVRREIYEQIDYILDYCLYGWCDSAFNIPTFKDQDDWVLYNSPSYKKNMQAWLDNAYKVFQANGGGSIVRGNLLHFEHSKDDKRHEERGIKDVEAGRYNFFDEGLYRDEDFVLRVKPGSRLDGLLRPNS